MSGKPYTLREMKSIVDYLTENNLYGEIKGRKMWTDYANSNKTMRTWQSLKETFLKRILPDITNPYYRLDPDQILSFKRGVDLTRKDKKLEFRPVDKSINNGVSGDNDQPCSSKNKEENATGEDIKCSKIVHDRASTETLILDTCYQTAEDIQRDLESTDEEKDRETRKTKSKHPIKSVRDFIEYTEPLTPMLQEVLDDFATDEDCSDTEQPMQIDENYVTPDEILVVPENPTPSQSILNPNRTQNQTKLTTTEDNDEEKVANEKHKPQNDIQSDGTTFSQLQDVMVLVDEGLTKDIGQESTVEKEKQDKQTNSFESSVPMTDSLLPNNQEAVHNSTFGVNSPAPTSIDKGDDKEGNTKEAQDDINLFNSNLISDVEPDLKNSEAKPIKINSEEKSNNNEPIKQNSVLNMASSNKLHVTDDKVHEINSDSSASDKDIAPQDENPCLKSVSLYAEQLVTTKYSDSDSNNKNNVKQNTKDQMRDEKKENVNHMNERKGSEDQNNDKGNLDGKTNEGVILLNSRTTSESDDDSEVNHRPLARSSLKRQKDKQLASVFGFSNGSAAKSRRLGSRKRTISHHNIQSDSSEWTSTSDSEYVSPPNGRRNRHARKYLKPHSARIRSLEEEGGLFVMLRKKIYPLVKDGKLVKNFISFLPESDPEEDDSYWKSKYIEERKRRSDLKKKLVHSKSIGVIIDKEEKESSVSLPSLVSPLNENRPTEPQSRQGSLQGNELMRRDSTLEKSASHEMLKIKFTKNDQEVQLEGHWQHINPVLAQVVSMLQKTSVEKKKPEAVTCVELSSGNTTPIDNPHAAGVHEKINEIESEIFKEIEEKDSDEQQQVLEQNKAEENNAVDIAAELNDIEENAEKQPQVTQRKKRGRPRKVAEPAVAQSLVKRTKKSSSRSDVEESKAGELLEKRINEEKIKSATPNIGRPARSPRKLLNGNTPKPKATRKSTSKTPIAPVETPENPIEGVSAVDEEILYKFPSPVPEGQEKPTKNKSKESPKKHLPITSPDSLSRHSINSSQGYQDSDTSPFNINIRRRRRLSVSASIKGRKMQRKHRSRSFPLLKLLDSDQSEPSSNSAFKIISREQSTIRSEIYKSESYQFLMPRGRLEKINEAKNEIDALEDKIRGLRDEILQARNPTNKSDPASSSNVSLPMSPELSIVENLSVSKSAILEISDLPTINEMQCNTSPKTHDNKYLMSSVDVSMPLMAQRCELQEAYRKHVMAALSNLSDAPNSAGRHLSNDSSMKISITESILKDLASVDIETSDSLDRRLEQLLLESAQKPMNPNREEKMEIDTLVKKKSGSKKRCSTPHKRKSLKSVKKVFEEPVIIEEESKAQCSRGVRRSCPPSINVVYCEHNTPDDLEIDLQEASTDVSNVTTRKKPKKSIIKVKIIKPKDKPLKKKKTPTKKNVTQSSGLTEGENESGVFLQGFDDSSDLIHNHTESCLKSGDCATEDSLQFIETTTKSIISLNSSSYTSENKENLCRSSMESGKMSLELYCDNAQCATSLREAKPTEVQSADSGNTVYFTPFATQCNSALTEDLSNKAPVTKLPYRPSKWYLLSDDESTSSYFDVDDNTPSYGANLKQIFPITCAVPDLSTITEMSEKNDSQKPNLNVEDSRRDTN